MSGLVLTISGVEEEQPLVDRGVGSCWSRSKWLDLPRRCWLNCGAGPIWLGLPQRGLGETGKSPITTVKHRRVIVVCLLVLYYIAIYIPCIKLLICLCMIAFIINRLVVGALSRK